jgi:hypothetical protein
VSEVLERECIYQDQQPKTHPKKTIYVWERTEQNSNWWRQKIKHKENKKKLITLNKKSVTVLLVLNANTSGVDTAAVAAGGRGSRNHAPRAIRRTAAPKSG